VAKFKGYEKVAKLFLTILFENIVVKEFVILGGLGREDRLEGFSEGGGVTILGPEGPEHNLFVSSNSLVNELILVFNSFDTLLQSGQPRQEGQEGQRLTLGHIGIGGQGSTLGHIT